MTTTQTHPLRDALETAIASRDEAKERWFETESTEAQAALDDAEQAVETARDAYIDSDEPREWILREEGYDYAEVEASSMQEALEIACDGVDRGNYSDAEGTIWIGVSVRCELTGEEDSATVTCEPEEPSCDAGDDHDWQSPHALVGGLEENPGVHGHGGGVIIDEVCVLCGCGRTTDTWAQDRSTGRQGLRSVSYEPGRYADEVLPVEVQRAMVEIDGAGCEQATEAAALVLLAARGDEVPWLRDRQMSALTPR